MAKFSMKNIFAKHAHKIPKTKNFLRSFDIEPPKPDRKRQGIAIVCIVKNEALYIGEWARYHNLAGVRHFIVYDNGCTDETVSELEKALPDTAYTVAPWILKANDHKSGKVLGSQVLAYCHAICTFGSSYRWMAFIDVDEFLVPKSASSLEEALHHTSGFPNVSLPWHMFGNPGFKSMPSGGVIGNYTKRAREVLGTPFTNFKCIVDPCEVTCVGVHKFETRTYADITCNDSGKTATNHSRKQKTFNSARHIQLNHYYSRSEEELEAKLKRGSNNPLSRFEYEARVRESVKAIQREMVNDYSIQEFLSRRSNWCLTKG